MNQLDMRGRHAVITGGATGLGYAIAQRMLASGASVTLWDRDTSALSKACAELGSQAHGVTMDVGDHASVVAAVSQTLKQSPAIDALVNCAGITGPNTKVWSYPVADWQQVMQVNLNGLKSHRTCASATTAALSTSPRWPARTATPTPAPTAPARPR
jgi:3-oxoacyl-[acyl-carrier protein] reductase